MRIRQPSLLDFDTSPDEDEKPKCDAPRHDTPADGSDSALPASAPQAARPIDVNAIAEFTSASETDSRRAVIPASADSSLPSCPPSDLPRTREWPGRAACDSDAVGGTRLRAPRNREHRRAARARTAGRRGGAGGRGRLEPAVSPLGTPEQLAAERIATQTVNSLPVALMKLVLRQQFLHAAATKYPDGPDAENLAALDNAVNEYAMAASFQQQLLDPMTPTVVTQVAPPHTWYGRTSAARGSSTTTQTPSTASWRVNGAS